MTVRTADALTLIRAWVENFEDAWASGARGLRVQFPYEDRDGYLTMFRNQAGCFVLEPGAEAMPVADWLAESEEHSS